MRLSVFPLLLISALVAGPAGASRDGRRFDPGATMTSRSPGAPAELDSVSFMLGQWDVAYERYADDSLVTDTDGQAEITYMNRGHGLMERFYCPDAIDGGELSTVTFLVFNKAADTWVMGVANSYTENITVSNGNFEGEYLTLMNVLRRRGGATLTYYRTTISNASPDGFIMETRVSTDGGETWTERTVRSYSRRTPSDDFMAPGSMWGSPAPDLPREAHQFDFLIGQWKLAHDITLPGGQEVQFPATGTAVYVLDGHAVMEFSWYDVDQNLPDAATSIVRIYNRQMRRWECMYSTNRFNSILYFGGVKEGNRIVLHQFGADAADSPINQWVFHDWTSDGYGWYGNTSTDRGETWKKTWIIEGKRN